MKKIIIIVTTILLLGLLGFYFIKEDKNLENPNNDYNEIDVNEKSNDTVVNDNVELLKVKDKKLEELVYLNKDNDLIEISKQDYLKLLKIHQDEIILFNKDDELIFSGKLIEDNNKFYLLRAKLEEIVSSIDYQVEQEENQSIERKLLSSSNNGIKLQDKRYFAHDIESSKNNDNYELLLQIRLLAELELSLSNLKVGISINPFKNKYKFDYSYDYQIKLDYKNENRLRIGELAKQIEKYQEKLKPQVEPDFNQGIKTTLFNQAIFNSDEIKRYELENPDKANYIEKVKYKD